MSTIKTIDKCRACDGIKLIKYYDYGDMPLANKLSTDQEAAENIEKYPLSLMYCNTCYLSQISVVISPEVLYSHYIYRSSMSQDYKDHCRNMAERVRHLLPDKKRAYVVDIAGNDGTLLKQFRTVFDPRLYNIDPAHNLCVICMDDGIAAHNAFWSKETATKLFSGDDKPDIITATNVFAHVDNVKDFIAGIDIALAPRGVFIVEFPHVTEFLENSEFDTCYHEHLSYFSLSAFQKTLDESGLIVFDAEKYPIHGGTLRLYICREGVYNPSLRVSVISENESFIKDKQTYTDFQYNSNAKINIMEAILIKARRDNKKVAFFGASAKGNTFLNTLKRLYPNATDSALYIVDETPEKIGKYAPGIGLKIVSMDRMLYDKPDIVINLAWNFKAEIETKLRKLGFKGEIFCPV